MTTDDLGDPVAGAWPVTPYGQVTPPAGYGQPGGAGPRAQQPMGPRPAQPPNGAPAPAPGPRPLSVPLPPPQGPAYLPAGPPVPIPSAAALQARRQPVRIGLWGSTRSGKTTFLGALPIAATQAGHGHGRWMVNGLDEDSTELLVEGVERMVVEHRFPPATERAQPYSWSFNGEVAVERRWPLRPAPARPVEFILDVQDMSGEAFRMGGPFRDAAITNLARSDGLVYLFDPVLDAEADTESFTYFFGTLQELATRVRDEGRLHRGRLPHHVAVCVTKFDDVTFFQHAISAGWVVQDGSGALPRVPQEQGRGFFDWVCDEVRGGTARHVRDALRNAFLADRMSFYATSAIGFRLTPAHQFDYGDYRNTEWAGNELTIRSNPQPVNVLEPLLDLERRISEQRG